MNNDPMGEMGKDVADAIPWQDAMAFEGSTQVGYIGHILKTVDWWRLVPYRDRLIVDDVENTLPQSGDLTPPHCAAIVGDVYVVYMPRGNGGRSIVLSELDFGEYDWQWINPRSGEMGLVKNISVDTTKWLIPDRPDHEDWVCLLIRK